MSRRTNWLRVGALVRITHTSSVRRVVELDGDNAVRLVTVEGTPLPLEGGWYSTSRLEPAKEGRG